MHWNRSKKAQNYYQKYNNERGLANISERLGDVLRNKNDFAAALTNYSKSMEICQRQEDQIGIANMNVKVGLTFLGKGDSENALDHLEKALTFYDSVDVPDKQAFVLAAIGQILLSGDSEKALKFLNRQGKSTNGLATGHP